MKNPFVWLAGPDPKILSQCTHLTESKKFAGFGTTVLIPATLGLFSMGYAVSTFSADPRIYITGAMLWFLIVLAIDRFLVSTLYRSSLKSNRDFWIAFVFRILFAGVVGLAVSHPLVLFLFNGSIHTKIEDMKRSAVEARVANILERKENVQKGETAGALKEKVISRKCLESLMTAEQSGTETEVKDENGQTCGYSSGLAYCGPRCENIKERIQILDGEIKVLNAQVQDQLTTIGNTTQHDIEEIKAKFPEDYPARVHALAAIEKEEPHVFTVKVFLLGFFVFLDTLLVLLKGTTPTGEYEQVRDTLLFEVEAIETAKREAISAYAATVYKSTAAAERNYDAKKDEIMTLIRVTNSFIKDQEREREIFDEQLKHIAHNVKTVKDEDTRNIYLARLSDLRNTFNSAWGKALTSFQDYLKGL
jgi:hypothetical protein